MLALLAIIFAAVLAWSIYEYYRTGDFGSGLLTMIAGAGSALMLITIIALWSLGK